MRKRNPFSFIVALSLVAICNYFWACKKDSVTPRSALVTPRQSTDSSHRLTPLPPALPPQPALGGPGVYVTVSINSVAVYWKDGKPVKLSGFEANGIAVSGNDVYVAGDWQYAKNRDYVYSARYWKNGAATALSIDSVPGILTSIVTSGTDVYVCGFLGAWDIFGTDNPLHAKYWKNGSGVDLAGAPSSANSIFISGADVYAAGHKDHRAVYWKNGVAVKLVSDMTRSSATSILVAGDDVYVAGAGEVAGASKLVYWKNGTMIILSTTSAIYPKATSLFISGNDVYVAGYDYSAKYWKNGTEVRLTNGPGKANSIFVSGDDVYVAGSEGSSAGYWKNGDFFNFGVTYTTATSIIVVK